VIFDEPKQFALIADIGKEMKPHLLGRSRCESGIESLVVAEVEPLLLQFPFEVPIGFGYKREIEAAAAHRFDYFHPVFLTEAVARPLAPCILKNPAH
jgi:hypothetical protein